MPKRLGLLQAWLTVLLLAMVVGVAVTDGVERRNMALVGIFTLIGLFASTRQKGR